MMLGTKWPSMISTCTQSEPHSLKTFSTAVPRLAKSADNMLGAMIAGGDIFITEAVTKVAEVFVMQRVVE